MILDKLLEKKDITAYLELRRDFLKSELGSELPKLKPEDRELIRERFIVVHIKLVNVRIYTKVNSVKFRKYIKTKLSGLRSND